MDHKMDILFVMQIFTNELPKKILFMIRVSIYEFTAKKNHRIKPKLKEPYRVDSNPQHLK